ncbi:MAG: hypothetical protein QHJ73_17810, partial [Armatimonadota bacterium]|nr:hypothetical protein [Armatimonadota bacterium]
MMELSRPQGFWPFARLFSPSGFCLGAALAAWLCLCGAPGAHAAAGPGRIAVAGTYPTGYVGLLARNGLPRDILLDYQLDDADLLARYDLVIAAGMNSTVLQSAWPGLQRVLARGGGVLLDYSYPTAMMREWMLDRRRVDPRAYRNVAAPITSRQPFRLIGDANPLRLEGSPTEF